jgi:hypothetical protein
MDWWLRVRVDVQKKKPERCWKEEVKEKKTVLIL